MSNGTIVQELHEAFAPRVLSGLARAAAHGVTVVLDSGRRSGDEQAKLYAIYRAGGPRAAPPGQSAHEYGLAVDIAVVEGGRKLYSGRAFDQAKKDFTEAGCQFLSPLLDDPGHAQHPEWRQLAQLQGFPGAPAPSPAPMPSVTPSPPGPTGTRSTGILPASGTHCE